MNYQTKILFTEFVTHDVKRFILEKPKGFKFIPGQAADFAINQPGWEKAKRPFTFTSLNRDLVLELTMKIYPERRGVTEKMGTLLPGDEILMTPPFGTINYQGKGVFLAAGAGVTPFIAILRSLREEKKLAGNKLIFSNKKAEDVILEKEFQAMFPVDDLTLTLTREKKIGYDTRRIDGEFLKKFIGAKNYYVCGPKPFVADVRNHLKTLGASVESVVFEK